MAEQRDWRFWEGRRVGRVTGWLASLALASATLAPTGTATAEQPDDQSLTSHTERDCPPVASCTFTASGATIDSGAVSSELARAGADNSPATGDAQYLINFSAPK